MTSNGKRNEKEEVQSLNQKRKRRSNSGGSGTQVNSERRDEKRDMSEGEEKKTLTHNKSHSIQFVISIVVLWMSYFLLFRCMQYHTRCNVTSTGKNLLGKFVEKQEFVVLFD